MWPTSINGEGTVAEPASPLAAVTDFYRAFNHRELDKVSAAWAHTAEIVMDNPLGGVKRGWTEIEAVYRRLFQGPARVYVEFYDITALETADMFCVTGRERGELTCEALRLPLAIRTSRVFQRLESRWRQVHHHGSIDDPQQLAAYQAAVSGLK